MIILKIILCTGAGFLITTALGSFVCIASYPIISGNCIKVTSEVYSALFRAGIGPTVCAGTTFFGSAVYFLAGWWKGN